MSLKGVFFLSQKVFFVRSSESFINVNILCDLLWFSFYGIWMLMNLNHAKVWLILCESKKNMSFDLCFYVLSKMVREFVHFKLMCNGEFKIENIILKKKLWMLINFTMHIPYIHFFMNWLVLKVKYWLLNVLNFFAVDYENLSNFRILISQLKGFVCKFSKLCFLLCHSHNTHTTTFEHPVTGGKVNHGSPVHG